MHFDKTRGLYLPGSADGKGLPDVSGPQEGKGHGEGRRLARRKLIPGTIGGAIGAAVVAGLCAVSQHIPAPYNAILPAWPVFFLDPLVDLLDSRKEIFPNRSLPWRRVLITAGYTALLVVALNVEGAVLQGITGSDSGLLIANLLTAMAMGVLIGWSRPPLAAGTIVEVSFAGSVLGVLVDLSFLGWRGFEQVHASASAFVVMAETGTLFAVAGLTGYAALRAVRTATHAGGSRQDAGGSRQDAGGSRQDAGGSRQDAGGSRQDAGGSREDRAGKAGWRLLRGDSRRNRLAIAVTATGLLCLTGIATYALGYARAASTAPAPAIYPVQGQIARADGIVLSLTGLEVFPSGSVVVALTYQNTGRTAFFLNCQGYASPAAATIGLADGRTESSTATFCSSEPGSMRRIGPGQSVISDAEFPDARGLDQPFSFSWHSGVFSGTLPDLDLAG
jgi:hypothetical protein